jgi:ribosome modulation factor
MPRKSGTSKPMAAAAPTQTLEQLSDDQVYSLTEQHRRKYESLLKAKKDADANLKNHCKILKSDLGAHGLADIKSLIEGETEVGAAAIKSRVERDIRVLRWLNEPIGTIHDLFPKTDAAPLDERAFNTGKRDGLAGNSRNNPHHHTVSAHKAYEDGYVEGQTTLAGGIKKADFVSTQGEMNADADRHIRETAAKLGTQPATHTLS